MHYNGGHHPRSIVSLCWYSCPWYRSPVLLVPWYIGTTCACLDTFLPVAVSLPATTLVEDGWDWSRLVLPYISVLTHHTHNM